ncbi:MAG: TIGR02147 family protein [Bdellovibrionota bacterium]
MTAYWNIEVLFRSKNYRAFLNELFRQWKVAKPGRSLASLARDAGFSSKSYFRDIVIGKKRLTLNSFSKLVIAFRLSQDLRNYLKLFAALEEKELNSENLDENRIREKLFRLKFRIGQRSAPILIKQKESSSFFGRESWLEIYASLGTEAKGANLSEIAKRSGLPKAKCAQILREMCAADVCKNNESKGRYYPLGVNRIYVGLGGERYMKEYFLKLMSELQVRAQERFYGDDRLFFNSVFSVSKSQLSRLKEELQSQILSFVENSEDSNGDTVVRLGLGLV